MPTRFHLAWFFGNTFGVHDWVGPWRGAGGREWARPDFQVDLARALDRACFDYLLMEDSSFVPDDYGGSTDFYLRNAARVPKSDPVPLIPVLAGATSGLGIVSTIATTFYPPYLTARLFATLDHMTDGRVGINMVTATNTRASENFGLEAQIQHDLRYEMAMEYGDALKALWDTWERDAIVNDPATGTFVDPAKVREADFVGKFYRTRGPLNTAPGPQHHPVLTQAGDSTKGRELAARHADSVLAAFHTIDQMKAYRADVRRRLHAAGRDPDSCKILFVVSPTLGDTREEAQEKAARQRAMMRENPEIGLAMIASLVEIDFSRFDLDTPLEELATNGQQGILARFAGSGNTLREVVANWTYGYEDLVGTPDDVAAQMGELMEEVGGDGVLFSPPALMNRRYVTEICDGLVPALQARGLTRTEYTASTLRGHLLEF